MQSTPLSAGTRLTYGSGGTAYGVYYNAHYFVLIFYSQVLGLDPALAGVAVSIGLIIDAVSDPLIGYLSDNTHSRWGRRHPWLIASIFPLGGAFFFLWHPPALIEGDMLLFVWLAVCNSTMRIGITMFLVPAYALVAELTEKYDERTRLMTAFHVFYSVVGNGMSVLMYAIWLVPTDEVADGVMNAAGYQNAGVFGAAAIVISILVFSFGLRKYIPKLRQFEVKEALGIRQFFRQAADVFRSHSARMTTLAGIMYYIGVGTYVVLWVYIYSYFWEFDSKAITIIVTPMALAALFLPPVMKRLIAGREKKKVAIIGILGAMLVNALPITLRLLGVFPENGTDVLLWTMVVAGFLETNLFLMFDISWRSMTSDLAERVEIETGRRNEGIISSTITFVTKCADALGTLVGGVLLKLIAFPTEAAVGEVPDDVIRNLGLIYGPLVFLIWIGVIVAIGRYRISRTRHQEMIDQLRGR